MQPQTLLKADFRNYTWNSTLVSVYNKQPLPVQTRLRKNNSLKQRVTAFFNSTIRVPWITLKLMISTNLKLSNKCTAPNLQIFNSNQLPWISSTKHTIMLDTYCNVPALLNYIFTVYWVFIIAMHQIVSWYFEIFK